jgi:hypothetical protein
MKTVYVVTNPDLGWGWGCVVAVLESLSATGAKTLEDKGYIVSEMTFTTEEDFLSDFDS